MTKDARPMINMVLLLSSRALIQMHKILLEAASAGSKALVRALEEQGLKLTFSINYLVVPSLVEGEELAEDFRKTPEVMTYSQVWALASWKLARALFGISASHRWSIVGHVQVLD